MPRYVSKSEEETKSIAAKLAKETKGRVFALSGELGAGKTIFAQGFAKGLGISEKVISPTFVLIRQHPIPNIKKVLYHIDLYRLENIIDTDHLGLPEIWSDPNNLVLIEWADRIEKLLPKDTVKINIIKEDNQNRTIIVS